MAPWLLLQLSDGSFPSGGFAHSGGLEAAHVLGVAEDVAVFLDAALGQLGQSAVPFVRAAAEAPARLADLDDAFDATMPMRGPNHASRAQGRSLASAAARVWEADARVLAIRAHTSRGPAHHAVIFGALFGALEMSADDTLAAFLHGAARSVLSAAVRLGLVGPLEAQRLLAERAPLLGSILATNRARAVEDAAQTAPLLELFAALHERLDGRMFQS